MGRPTKLDVPMDARLTIKTTERAKIKLKERAAAKAMSLGEYLDWMTQQSAVKNDLTETNPDPQTLMQVLTDDKLICPNATDGQHIKGGQSATGVRRCRNCGRTFINNQWTDSFQMIGLGLPESQPLKQTDDESDLSSYETGFQDE